jgi:NAD(P)-dependent dehydrogenase (short-subunit alcohol dehydrogenase family)
MSPQTIALITGANKGIGFEVATQLAGQGVLVLVGARDEERGRVAVDALLTRGLPAAPLQIDVTDDESITTAAREIDARYGQLDILVNNAGISGGAVGSPSEITRARMRQIYETNVFGADERLRRRRRHQRAAAAPAQISGGADREPV